MTKGDDPAAAAAEHGDGEQPKQKQGWRRRLSIRVLRREAIEPGPGWADSDRRDNSDTHLPASETVHLGGLILAEAFTPSTVSALYKALEDFGAQHRNKDMWIAQLAKGRSAAGGAGGLTLPVVRRPGSWVLGVGLMQIDPALPDGIDSVNLDLFFPTPSLTMIVATFTLTDQAGDLSELLRADYHTIDFRMWVGGRFDQARARIPWARSVHHRVSRTLRTAEDQKGLACESVYCDGRRTKRGCGHRAGPVHHIYRGHHLGSDGGLRRKAVIACGLLGDHLRDVVVYRSARKAKG